MDILVAVKELIEKEKESALHKLADVCGYAENGPTFDPEGKYLCGSCKFRMMPNKCAVMKGDVSMEAGGCIVYAHGPQIFDKPLEAQFSPEHVIYTERPTVKSFGCEHCEYAKDEGIQRYKCEVWQMYVMPKACCYLNEGKDDHLKTSAQINAYGTSEGAFKGWDSRGRIGEREQLPSGTEKRAQELKDDDEFVNARVPLSRLTPTQDYIGDDKVQYIAKHWDESRAEPVELIRHGGKLYIWDGHHRVAARVELNQESTPARIYDVRAYGTSEGVTKAWDTRGRGRKEIPPVWKSVVHWQYESTEFRNISKQMIQSGKVDTETDVGKILDAVRNGEVTSSDLHRGMHASDPKQLAGFFNLKEGDKLQLDQLSSFSFNQNIGRIYMHAHEQQENHVMLTIAGGAKGLNTATLGTHVKQFEQEFITEGQFEVTDTKDEIDPVYGITYRHVFMRQLGVI